ncbi:curli production assembly protein CsgF [Pseudoalteromonas spongiae]|nr:curli production assembly/transport component CsgF [Pseudoalteromonas spongiae UST010723-006]TMO88574.1 curli production assembly protein CsgF [Pseudoalteromonas spongiae]
MVTIKMINKIIVSSVLLVFSSCVVSTELVYTPVNPSFGGSPLNGAMLLNKAQSQNKHRAPINEKTYAEKFQESLERSYINRMVREITDLAFGEGVEDSMFNQDSIFTSGDYEIQILTSGSDTITVQITNMVTGEVVVVEVPRFGE